MAKVTYDFNSGALDSDWSTQGNGIKFKSSPTREGAYSVTLDEAGYIWIARWEPSALQGGTEIDAWSFHYWETNNSSGHIVYVADSNGNPLFGIGSNNYQQTAWLGETTGYNQVGGGSGSTWYKAQCSEIDYSTGEVKFQWINPDGSINNEAVLTVDTIAPIASINISPSDPNNSGLNTGATGSLGDTHIDLIAIDVPRPAEVKGTVKRDGVGVIRDVCLIGASSLDGLGSARSDATGSYLIEFENAFAEDVYVIVLGEPVADERAIAHGPVAANNKF